jgi:hypothetical protein
MSAYGEARLLAEGIEGSAKLLKRDHAKKLLKATLPNQADFIDKNDPSTYHFLLEELKDRLLDELKKMLRGDETDMAEVDQTKKISAALKQIERDRIDRDIASVEAKIGQK